MFNIQKKEINMKLLIKNLSPIFNQNPTRFLTQKINSVKMQMPGGGGGGGGGNGGHRK